MNKTLLYAILFASAAAAVAIGVFLIFAIKKRARLGKIYAMRSRDERFALSLLSFVFGDKIIRNPFILEDATSAPPNVAAAFVCSGGVALISICRGEGKFVAPDNGKWTLDDGRRTMEIENLAVRGNLYTAELSGLIMRKSLSCPTVRHYVFLTDDYARYDYRSSDSVLGGADLIAELKSFSEFGALDRKEQVALCELIVRHSEHCKKHFASVATEKKLSPALTSAMGEGKGGTADTEISDEHIPDPIDFDDVISDDDSMSGETEKQKTAVMRTAHDARDDNDDDDTDDDDEFDIKTLFGKK